MTPVYEPAARAADAKVFSFRHLFFGGEEQHSETALPAWLAHRDYKWFLDEHVLTLEVGGFVDTDFQRITRVG